MLECRFTAIQFHWDGDVTALVPDIFSGRIGTFAPGSVVYLRVEFELNDTWRIYIDDVLAHAGGFGDAQVQLVSFGPNHLGVIARLDDVRITARRVDSVVSTESASWASVKALFH